VAPTAVAVVEQAIDAWNEGQRERLVNLAQVPLPDLALPPLEPVDYRTVGESVVVTMEDRSILVFTVKRSMIRRIERFQPGEALPEALRARD
jgi:hypothetical protein